MNLRQVIATLPWLRKLWRFLPGPLRVPLLVVAAVVWLWRRGSDEPTGGDAGSDGGSDAS